MKQPSSTIICDVDYEELVIRMEEFHGYRSPGILLGAIMLDAALRELGPTQYLNVVSETVVCLPDAIQLLTPCTAGNGFLQILDWGKFALAAYDRETLSGIRTWLNPGSLPDYPKIHSWFDRTVPKKKKPPFEELSQSILANGLKVIRHRQVKLHCPLKNQQRVETGVCPQCNESYPLDHGPACRSCQGESYYRYG